MLWIPCSKSPTLIVKAKRYICKHKTCQIWQCSFSWWLRIVNWLSLQACQTVGTDIGFHVRYMHIVSLLGTNMKFDSIFMILIAIRVFSWSCISYISLTFYFTTRNLLYSHLHFKSSNNLAWVSREQALFGLRSISTQVGKDQHYSIVAAVFLLCR